MKEPRSPAAIGRHAKGKGADGELQVIRLIQPWWRRLEPEALFVRTPGSGGWKYASSFKARGDLQVNPATTLLFPFSVEVKWRNGWSDEFLFGRRPGQEHLGDASPVWDWWYQCCDAAQDDGFQPMLWFRKDRAPWRVMIRAAVYDQLRVRGMSAPLVRFPSPRHTVVLTHAQTLWLPPHALVAACTKA